MILRHPGISPTNDLVAKKIFSNPEITCQFIRDMLDLPAKNVTILEGSNIHVLPSMPYSAQDFYTSIDVLQSWTMARRLLSKSKFIIRIFLSIACGLTCVVRLIKILKKFANEKVIHTRVINTLHLFTPLQLWIVIISKMTWLSTVLACARIRQVRF